MDNIFGDIFTDYTNGVRMDLRFKLAVEFLKIVLDQDDIISKTPPALAASYAITAAEELVGQGLARGLLKDMPDTSELSAYVARHAERTAAFQVRQQSHAHRLSQEANPIIRGGPN